MPIDRTAAEGFEAGASSYQRARPDYPRDAVAWLAAATRMGPDALVVDLGAGTGKLTALLTSTGARLLSIEPVEAMRRHLALLNGIEVVAAVAEAIPLADGSVDAVVAAQAFHWFDAPRALAEIRRVLRPRGRLGLMWNLRDTREPWVAEMARIVDAYGNVVRRHESGEWKRAFVAQIGFGPLTEAEFANVQVVAPEQVVDRVASTSFIATLPDEERAAVLARIRTLIETHPDTAARSEIVFPHRTRVYWCERL